MAENFSLKYKAANVLVRSISDMVSITDWETFTQIYVVICGAYVR